MLALALALTLAHGGHDVDDKTGVAWELPSNEVLGGGAVGVVVGGVGGVASGAVVTMICARLAEATEAGRCRALGGCIDKMDGGQTMLKVGFWSLPVGAIAGAVAGGVVGASLFDHTPPPSQEPLD